MEFNILIQSFLSNNEKYVLQISTMNFFYCRKFSKIKVISLTRKTVQCDFLIINSEYVEKFSRSAISCSLPSSKFLTKLKIEDNFQNINSLSSTLKSLCINGNSEISSLPQSLRKLRFTVNFKSKLPKLPHKLKELRWNNFCSDQTENFIAWPPNLKLLEIGIFASQKQINMLPNTLQTLIICRFVNFSIVALSIKKLIVTGSNSAFRDLPMNIEIIIVKQMLTEFYVKFPASLRKIKCCKTTKFIGFEGDNVTNVYFDNHISPSQKLNLPKSIETLQIGYVHNYHYDGFFRIINLSWVSDSLSDIYELKHSLEKLHLKVYDGWKLPEKLLYFSFDDTNIPNFKFPFPKNLRYLRIGAIKSNRESNNFLTEFNFELPNFLVKLVLGKFFSTEIMKWPNSLKILEIYSDHWEYSIPNNLDSIFIRNLKDNWNTSIPRISMFWRDYLPFKIYNSHYLVDINGVGLDMICHYSKEKIKHWRIPEIMFSEISIFEIPDWVERIEIIKHEIIENYLD